MNPDRRLTLAWPAAASGAAAEIADARLQGLVAAAAYRPARPMRCAVPAAALRRAPGAEAEQEDQLLFGEDFDVLFVQDGWAFGQARRDGYVDWVRLDHLAEGRVAADRRVSALRAYAFARPDIKSPPVGLYSLNALVRIEAREGRFARGEGTGWFVESQLSPVGRFESDPAAVAERFVGAAYQWGGRESLGLDCSGLVQQALYACGRACPRDTDMQLAGLGAAIPGEALRRNDLVFWRGHVGLMLDEARLVHANAFHMAAAVEPLAEAVRRIADQGGGPPTGFRRL